MSLQMPNAVVAQMHELAAEMGVRLHRAGEQAGQFIKPFTGPPSVAAKAERTRVDWPAGAGASMSLDAGFGLLGAPSASIVHLRGGLLDVQRRLVADSVDRLLTFPPGCGLKVAARYQRNTAGPTPHNVFDFVGAFDPAALRKVLQGFGHSPVEVERRVHEGWMDAASRGQPIKQEVEELPEQDWNCAALEALSLAAGKSDEKAFEARRRLGESLARQHAELEALEVQATNYQRAFETLSAQLDALMSPPPARRTGVKPAIAGLTRTVAEDHRLGRFKG